MILYISTMVVNNKWNLMFVKNILGELFYKLLIKYLNFTNKSNRIWMFIGWILLIVASLAPLYFSNFYLIILILLVKLYNNLKNHKITFYFNYDWL